MQVLLDNNGYVKEWILDETHVQMGHANALTIPTPSNLDVNQFRKEYKSYKLENGELVKDTNRLQELEQEKAALIASKKNQPTQLDRIEAQIAYTAMMTDTLLEG
jgi:hypothetical protein